MTTGAPSVFVTGATGVVGRRLVPLLVARGCRVTAVGRTAAKRAALEAQGARAVSFDQLDSAAARRGLAEAEPDVVVNLATHMPPSALQMMLPWSWKENDRVRREGSAALVDAALDVGVGRLVQESFAPIYADGGDRWVDEDWPSRPARYNRTVLDAERSAERFAERGGSGVVLRFAWFYGPDDLLALMAASVRRGWSPVPGDGAAYWSSIAHDDAATAVLAALDLPSGAYNVCDGEPLTRGELCAVLAEAVRARPPRAIPRWMTRIGPSSLKLLCRSLRMSHRKLREASGWVPRWRSAREGMPAALATLGDSGRPGVETAG